MKFFVCLIILLLCLIINEKSIAQGNSTSDFIGDLEEEGLVRFRKNGKWGFIDVKGGEAILPKYDFAYAFWGKLALVLKNNKWGFVNVSGEEVIPLEYDEVYRRSEGLARVKRDGKWENLNTAGTACLY